MNTYNAPGIVLTEGHEKFSVLMELIFQWEVRTNEYNTCMSDNEKCYGGKGRQEVLGLEGIAMINF